MTLQEKLESFGKKARNVAIGAGVLGLAALMIGGSHLDRDTYRARVTDKERVYTKREGEKSKYLVFTELENGKTRVFENTDSFLELKWNSSDIQGKLEEGKTYDIATYGFRIRLLSKYENITKVTRVE